MGLNLSLIGSVLWIGTGLRYFFIAFLNGFPNNTVINLLFFDDLESIGFLNLILLFIICLAVLTVISVQLDKKKYNSEMNIKIYSLTLLFGCILVSIVTFWLLIISNEFAKYFSFLISLLGKEYTNYIWPIVLIGLGSLLIVFWMVSELSEELNIETNSFNSQIKFAFYILIIGVIGGSFFSILIMIGGLLIILDSISFYSLNYKVRSDSVDSK